jgi:ribonuclease Z
VKTLVLTHFIPPFFDPVELREYVAKDFDGEIVIADDLTRVELPEVDSMFEARERA